MKKVLIGISGIIMLAMGYERINIIYKPEKSFEYTYKIIYTEKKSYYDNSEYYRVTYPASKSPDYKTEEKDVELYYRTTSYTKDMILIPEKGYRSPDYETSIKEIEPYYRYYPTFTKEKHYSIQYLQYGVYKKGNSVINIYGNEPVEYYLHNGEIFIITK